MPPAEDRLAAAGNALLGVAHHAPGAGVRDLFLARLLLPALPVLPDSLRLLRSAQLRRPARLHLSSDPPPLARPAPRARRAGGGADDHGGDPVGHRADILLADDDHHGVGRALRSAQ